MQELPCHEAVVLAILLGQTEQEFANHSSDEWRDDEDAAEATVPVKDGLAQIQIRGVHSGESLVQFKLTVVMPGAWPAR